MLVARFTGPLATSAFVPIALLHYGTHSCCAHLRAHAAIGQASGRHSSLCDWRVQLVSLVCRPLSLAVTSCERCAAY